MAAIGESLAGAGLTAGELTEALAARTGALVGDLVIPAFNGYRPRWRQATEMAARPGVLC